MGNYLSLFWLHHASVKWKDHSTPQFYVVQHYSLSKIPQSLDMKPVSAPQYLCKCSVAIHLNISTKNNVMVSYNLDQRLSQK